MKHSLYTSIPEQLDRKLRWRFRRLLWQKRLWSPWTGIVGALAVYACFFVVFTGMSVLEDGREQGRLVALRESIFTAQAAELAQAQEGIYHVRRVVSEGVDKPAYVAAYFGEASVAPMRVDVVETWQHNENARAEVRSTAHQHPNHTYLSRTEEQQVQLYLDAGPEFAYPQTRQAYDEAHDLGSLYQGFATTSAPALPQIPESARLVSHDPLVLHAQPEPGLEIFYDIDPQTLLVARERIYVVREGERYEMSTITYVTRTIEPAEQFDEVFDPTDGNFTQIARVEVE